MSRVIVVVEGQTEQSFVRQVLAPYLALKGVFVDARLVGKPGRKGGVGAYSRARRDILTILRQETAVFCTTMFDYYGMPHNWPQRRASLTVSFQSKAVLIEMALLEDVVQSMGNRFHSARFIPYIQMHEFEALLFSEPEILSQMMQQPQKAVQLREINAQFESPEMINDNVETAPSKRLKRLFPSYNKVLYGTLVSQRIGLPIVRQKCPHFSDWLAKLEALGSQ